MDEVGFYVRTKFCNPYHQYHPRRNHIRTPRKLIHADEIQKMKDSGEACTLAGTARNLHYVRSKRKGKYLPYYLLDKFLKFVKT